MSYCPNCATESSGVVCPKCGTPLGRIGRTPVAIPRAEVKRRARSGLGSYYALTVFSPMLAAFLFALAAFLTIGLPLKLILDEIYFYYSWQFYTDYYLRILFFIPLALLVFALLRVVMSVGIQKLYVQIYRKQRPEFATVFTGVHHFFHVLGGLMLRDLFHFFWSIIPFAGFVFFYIKGYSYSMLPYLLLDHPELSVRDALRVSTEMTNGYKGQLWKRDWSFFGWFVLSALSALGLAFFYVNPYYQLTCAGFYNELELLYFGEKSAQKRKELVPDTFCPVCGSALVDGVKFCENCGAPVGSTPPRKRETCSACGAVIPADAAFCENCGAPVGSTPPRKRETCSACGAVIPADAAFCESCGTPVGSTPLRKRETCSACGALVPADAAFCERCGSALRRSGASSFPVSPVGLKVRFPNAGVSKYVPSVPTAPKDSFTPSLKVSGKSTATIESPPSVPEPDSAFRRPTQI